MRILIFILSLVCFSAYAKIQPETIKQIKIEAEQGSAEQQFNLGWLYLEGFDIPKNETEAVKWLQLSADNGKKEALFFLSQCYKYGLGVNVDNPKADKLLLDAYELGDSDSLYNIGMHFYKGRKWLKLKADKQEAYGWFHKAAENGHADAQRLAGDYWDEKIGFEAEAIKFYLMSLKSGEPNSYTVMHSLRQIGNYYEQGKGVPANLVEAYAYYNVASGSLGGSSFDTEERIRIESKLTRDALLEGQKRSLEIQLQIGSAISTQQGGYFSSLTSRVRSYSDVIIFVICTLFVGACYTLIKEKLTKSSRGKTRPVEDKTMESSYSRPKGNKVTYFKCWWKTALVLLLLQGLLGYLNSGTQGMAVMLGRGIILSPLHALWIAWIWWSIKK